MSGTKNWVEVLPWSQTFETKLPLIDEQHKRLVTLLNEMGSKLALGDELLELDNVLDELHSYISYHFEFEEKIWNKYFGDDAWAIKHHQTHSDFIAKVDYFRQQARSGKRKALYEQILHFLLYWLAHHILDDDMRMAKVIHSLDAGILLQEAKINIQTEMSDSIEVFINSLLNTYGSLTSRTLELEEEKKEHAKVTHALELRKRQEQEFGNEIINSVPGLVYLCDNQQNLIRWNKRFIDDLGYSEDDLRSMKILDFIDKSQHKKVLTALSTLFDGKSITEAEANVKTKNGKLIPYLFTSTPFIMNDNPCFIGTGIDISIRKNFQDNLIRKSDELKAALIGIITAVSKALETRDPYTAGHQQRVKEIATAIAEKLGLNEERIEGLKLGASIHDIGKLAIPAEMLVKPTRLTELEYSVIKTHVEAGVNILKGVNFPWPVVDIIEQHHERLDGSGYPNGLKGNEISLEGRILAVSDVFEAMSAHRPYRPSLGIDKAMQELNINSGKLYDPQVVEALKEILKEEPERISPHISN
ncbi:bacteriohemerythrin [Shewanella mesophila]|uniref:bacteriohemerythrin n=1 Tax=Shewanella mesophila TaxID=2864208 RepID=UPI001C65DF91|nr:bacteriohemerythrin [Shewanella mesophila]QYJ86014.1 bacteriohemerythrin [Shewanella mesophila]